MFLNSRESQETSLVLRIRVGAIFKYIFVGGRELRIRYCKSFVTNHVSIVFYNQLANTSLEAEHAPRTAQIHS